MTSTFRSIPLLLVILTLAACTSVDSTERCVLTRYGKVVEQQMDVGLNWTPFTHATCFTMTEKNFAPDEMLEAQTRDPITVQGDVAVVYKFNPATIYEVFQEKRSQDQAEVEILNAIREGYKSGIAKWTMMEIFQNRSSLSDSVKANIQRKIGNRAMIQKVFIRDIKIPPTIENARLAAAQQDQILDKAQKQYVIDSVNSRAIVLKAEATSKAKQLEATSYSSNPKLLDLEIERARAAGISGACGANVQTCVIGGSVMDTWKR